MEGDDQGTRNVVDKVNRRLNESLGPIKLM